MAGVGGWGLTVVRSCRQLFLAVAAALFLSCPAWSQKAAQTAAPPPEAILEPPQEPPQPKYGWREVWTGSDAMRDVWLIYAGVTLAPWSEHVYAPGWRVRAQTGYGEYKHALDTNTTNSPRVTVSTKYADALIGYHWRVGDDLTVKFFGGVAFNERVVSRGVLQRGRYADLEVGAKAQLELWYNLAANSFTSLNLSFNTAHLTGSARWRLGYSPSPGFSIGPELRFDTSQNVAGPELEDFKSHYSTRGGIFMSYKWPEGIELSIAGGVASRVAGSEPLEIAPYGTVNLLFQF